MYFVFNFIFVCFNNGAVVCTLRTGNDVSNGAESSISCEGPETLVDCGFEAVNENSDGSTQKGWDGAYFSGNTCRARSGNWGMYVFYIF